MDKLLTIQDVNFRLAAIIKNHIPIDVNIFNLSKIYIAEQWVKQYLNSEFTKISNKEIYSYIRLRTNQPRNKLGRHSIIV